MRLAIPGFATLSDTLTLPPFGVYFTAFPTDALWMRKRRKRLRDVVERKDDAALLRRAEVRLRRLAHLPRKVKRLRL